MKTCTVVYNPHTPRLQDGQLVQQIQQRLLNSFKKVTIMKSEYPGHLIELVRLENGKVDLILSVGGDGTFNEVVTALHQEGKQESVIAHIPAGTTNDLGHTFGLSHNPIEALDQLLDGITTMLDYLLINGKPYSYIAAFGYLSGVAAETPNWLKQAFGRNGYLIKGIRRFFRDPAKYEISYVIDGKEYRDHCMFGIVTNAKGFGGIDVYNEETIRLNDRNFEFLYVKSMSKGKFLDLINKVLISKYKLENCPGTVKFTVSKLRIKSHRSSFREWSLDGEGYQLDGHEAVVEVAPRQLEILLPRETVKTICS